MLFQKVQHSNPTAGPSSGDTTGLTAGILTKGWDSRLNIDLGSGVFCLSPDYIFLNPYNKLSPGKCYVWSLTYSPGPKLNHSSQIQQEGTRKTWKEDSE